MGPVLEPLGASSQESGCCDFANQVRVSYWNYIPQKKGSIYVFACASVCVHMYECASVCVCASLSVRVCFACVYRLDRDCLHACVRTCMPLCFRGCLSACVRACLLPACVNACVCACLCGCVLEVLSQHNHSARTGGETAPHMNRQIHKTHENRPDPTTRHSQQTPKCPAKALSAVSPSTPQEMQRHA